MTYFLHTCRYNSTINYLFFTDQTKDLPALSNVTFVDFNLQVFNALASQKTGLSIEVASPYKLCDFKPAFGKIFEDYLTNCHFWGYTDIDLVFGNIRKFITEDLFNQYDVITAKKEYLVGHFTLYRNNPTINELYTRSQHYKMIFQVDTCCSFDECVYLWKKLLAGESIFSLQAPVESMTHVVTRLHNAGAIKALFSKFMLEQDQYDSQGNLEEWNDTLYWNNGNLMSMKEAMEYMYFHFHFLKKQKSFSLPAGEPGEAFYIQKTGFAHSRD